MKWLSAWLFVPIASVLGTAEGGAIPEGVTFSKRLEGMVYARFDYISLEDCHKSCLSRERCQSYNYMKNGKYCELNDGDGTSAGGQLKTPSDYVYSQKSEWNQKQLHSNCDECNSLHICVDAPGNNDIPCIITECERPDVPDGYLLRGNRFSVGSTFKYECAPGYVAEGSEPTITCQSDGTLTARAFLCRKYIKVYEYTTGSAVNPLSCWKGDQEGDGCFRGESIFETGKNVSKMRITLHQFDGSERELIFPADTLDNTDWFAHVQSILSMWSTCTQPSCVVNIVQDNAYFDIRSSTAVYLSIVQDGTIWKILKSKDCRQYVTAKEDTAIGRCYQSIRSDVTWNVARDSCAALDNSVPPWYLTDIKSTSEQDTVYILGRDSGASIIWTGGKNGAWLDGSGVDGSIVRWANGQPSRAGQECMSMVITAVFGQSFQPGEMDDEGCNQISRSFVCEKDALYEKLEVDAFVSM